MSAGNSKNAIPKPILLSETDFWLSENVQFVKAAHLLFSKYQKIRKKSKVQRFYFGRIECFSLGDLKKKQKKQIITNLER